MKVCQNCNTTHPDGVNICPQCSTPLVSVPPQQIMTNTADHTAEYDRADISANKVLAMVPYLMGWLGILITLLAAGTSAYAGFHVRQALKIQVCITLVTIVGAIIPVLGWIAIGVCGIIALVINIICFFNVCKGLAKEPPIVANLAFLK